MLILSLEFAVRLESPGPNSQLCIPLYDHSLDAVVPSNWFRYIDAARTRITEDISRDRYPASPLTRWLLPSNGLGIGPTENTSHDRYPGLWCDVTAHAHAVGTQIKHCCCIVRSACVAVLA
jgi:hypothetical protein